MDTFKALFVKPDPQAQLRKCNTMLRSNMRKLDRDIAQVKQVENKTRNLIVQADRRAKRDPNRQAQAAKETRAFARELVRARKTSARLVTSKAQLGSVQMQVNEAFAVRRIEGSIRASVGIMRDVNTLVRLPELAGTMRELGVELMKAGIIEEMVDDSLPEADLLADEDEAEAEGEIDRVLGEILRGKEEKAQAPAQKLPSAPVESEPVPAQAEAEAEAEAQAEEEDADTEAMMDQMRNRLEALRS